MKPMSTYCIKQLVQSLRIWCWQEILLPSLLSCICWMTAGMVQRVCSCSCPSWSTERKTHLARLRLSFWLDHLSPRWYHAFGRVFDFYLQTSI